MLRKIRLYGALAKFIGKRVLYADVATAAEAVRFLVANWPELERHMADQHYRVSVGAEDITLDDLHNPAGQQEIKIVPVVAGAGAAGRILAGVALIALAFIPGIGTATAAAIAAGAKAGLTVVGTVLFGVGASLVLGGVAQLLTPTPKGNSNEEQDPRKSFSFSGIQNTSRQGVPVPIVYGEVLVGSVVISAGIDTVQVVA
jgi:predicted phage tail protein